MLLTFFALATAVVLVVKRPVWQRVIILASAAPIAVASNVTRITVTGILHQTVSSEVANKVFHDLAGLLMMPLALGMLMLELNLLNRLLIPVDRAAPMPRGVLPTGLKPKAVVGKP
jgi:exosortase/archaeosortase family protein